MSSSVVDAAIENAPGAIRTHGPRIRNPVLYPPELRGHIGFRTDAGVLLSFAPLFVTINDELWSIEAGVFKKASMTLEL